MPAPKIKITVDDAKLRALIAGFKTSYLGEQAQKADTSEGQLHSHPHAATAPASRR